MDPLNLPSALCGVIGLTQFVAILPRRLADVSIKTDFFAAGVTLADVVFTITL